MYALKTRPKKRKRNVRKMMRRFDFIFSCQPLNYHCKIFCLIRAMPLLDPATMDFKGNSSELNICYRFGTEVLNHSSRVHHFSSLSELTINDGHHHLIHEFGFDDKNFSLGTNGRLLDQEQPNTFLLTL